MQNLETDQFPLKLRKRQKANTNRRVFFLSKLLITALKKTIRKEWSKVLSYVYFGNFETKMHFEDGNL